MAITAEQKAKEMVEIAHTMVGVMKAVGKGEDEKLGIVYMTGFLYFMDAVASHKKGESYGMAEMLKSSKAAFGREK